MAVPALGVASVLTQSPIQSALGFLSKKKKRKAKKKAKRKAKKQREQLAESFEAQGVAPAQARQMANQQAALGQTTAAVANVNPDGSDKSPFMKDYLGIGVPTIPVAAGLYFVAKQMGMFGKAKRTYRKRATRKRKR